MQFPGIILVVSIVWLCLSHACLAKSGKAPGARSSAVSQAVTPAYCAQVLTKVDSIVRKNFVDAKVATVEWPAAVKQHKKAILSSTNIVELGERMNALIKTLHTSHCEFATANDEIGYFLRSLFCQFGKKHAPLIAFTGAITGGVNCGRRQVRYVLDGSPAAASGILPGDEIIAVDGKPYLGQLSFAGTAGRAVVLTVKRNDAELRVKIKPALKDTYSCYVEATEKSARITKTPEGTIGYVHLWTGGERAHEMFETLLGGKLNSTDGLILDLRDGYGANFFNDLDYFYRPPAGYPSITMTWRSGKKETTTLVYDKPVVALINGGVRSGKELVAFSLKRTGRAKLVGERTAGSVVAGKLFPVDSRTFLYLAVAAGDVDGVNLEGAGVEPDIAVPAGCAKADKDRQFAEADRLIRQQLRERAGRTSGVSLPAQILPEAPAKN